MYNVDGMHNARYFELEGQQLGSCVGAGFDNCVVRRGLLVCNIVPGRLFMISGVHLRIRHTQVPRRYCVRRDPHRALHVSEGIGAHRVQDRA